MITLQYEDSHDGQSLKYRDDLVKRHMAVQANKGLRYGLSQSPHTACLLRIPDVNHFSCFQSQAHEIQRQLRHDHGGTGAGTPRVWGFPNQAALFDGPLCVHYL